MATGNTLMKMIALTLMLTAAAGATVLTFDDLPPLGSDPGVLYEYNNTPYGPFGWTSAGYLNVPLRYPDGQTGYNNGIVSGDYMGHNRNGEDVTIYLESGTFDFTGVYLVAAWRNGMSIDVIGENNGQQLYNRTIVVSTYYSTWFQFDYEGIDKLILAPYGGIWAGYSGGTGTNFGMDNLTYTPEPSLILLLAIGGCHTFRFKRQKQVRKA